MTSKLTANSVVFLLLTLFAVGVALVFRHPLLIYTAVFLVTTNVVLFFWSQRSVSGIAVTRRMPRLAVAQHPADITLELTNLGHTARFGMLGYDLHGKLTPGTEYSPVAFLQAPAGTTVEAGYQVTPQRSGVYPLGPFYLYGGDPFGFYKNWRKVADTVELTVVPNPVTFKVARQHSASHRMLDELETVAMAGESTEFMGVREYRTGEPLKRLHWPTTARLGRLISKQYEMSVSASIGALLILQPALLRGMFADNPKEYALRMIAGLARGTISDSYIFHYLSLAGTKIDTLQGSGYGFFQQLGMQLARLDQAAPPAWQQNMRYILHYLPRRSSLIVFLAELDEEARLWLRSLSAHYSHLSVVTFNRASFDRAQRTETPSPRLTMQDGYLVHEVGYRDDLGRVLAQVMARMRMVGGHG